VIGSLLGKNTVRVEKDREMKQPAGIVAKPEEEDEEAPAPAPSRVFPALVDPLTDRELEVLQLLGKGLTNQQIAVQLSVSESTVVYHIGHIFGKLRVSSRVEAAVWAKEHGII
jgi:DNA-binding NarL/FixJ family response regulator